jgi:hypothetical protein
MSTDVLTSVDGGQADDPYELEIRYRQLVGKRDAAFDAHREHYKSLPLRLRFMFERMVVEDDYDFTTVKSKADADAIVAWLKRADVTSRALKDAATALADVERHQRAVLIEEARQGKVAAAQRHVQVAARVDAAMAADPRDAGDLADKLDEVAIEAGNAYLLGLSAYETASQARDLAFEYDDHGRITSIYSKGALP